MLKMGLGADIDNIPYLLYMTEQEQRQRQEVNDRADRVEPLSFPSCDEEESHNYQNGF